jgi:hypothetical protein
MRKDTIPTEELLEQHVGLPDDARVAAVEAALSVAT